MSKEQDDFNQNVHRVLLNLRVLLDVGLFPGKHTEGLREVQGFIESLIADAKAKLEPQITPPAAPTPEPTGAK